MRQRVTISIALPGDLLDRIDRADANRAAFIERAVRAYLLRLENAEDADIVNRNADWLNAEVVDVLEYQRLPWP